MNPHAPSGSADPADAAEPVGLLGAVLAGGASRRLGRDKATERIGEDRLVDRAVEALRSRCARVVVIASSAGAPAGDFEVVVDRRPSEGPLVGLEAALAFAEAHGYAGVVALACDLPLVDGAVVAAVADALRPSSAEGGPAAAAAARTGDPDFEPLVAAYRTSCLAAARTLLDGGRRSARALFEAVDGVRVEVPEGALLNVNTEDDLAAARRATGAAAERRKA